MSRRKIWLAMAMACVFFMGFPYESSAQWSKTFSTGTDDLAGVMAPSVSSAGNYGLYGQISTDTTEKAFVSRHDSSGKAQWGKIISTGSSKESLVVRELDDGTFLVTGTKDLSATSTPANNIIWAKYNSSWTPVYQKMFGGARDEDGVYSDLTKDGGFFGIDRRDGDDCRPDRRAVSLRRSRRWMVRRNTVNVLLVPEKRDRPREERGGDDHGVELACFTAGIGAVGLERRLDHGPVVGGLDHARPQPKRPAARGRPAQLHGVIGRDGEGRHGFPGAPH